MMKVSFSGSSHAVTSELPYSPHEIHNDGYSKKRLITGGQLFSFSAANGIIFVNKVAKGVGQPMCQSRTLSFDPLKGSNSFQAQTRASIYRNTFSLFSTYI